MLILTCEIVLADRPADAFQGLARLSLGVQDFTSTAGDPGRSPRRLDRVLLVPLRDRRETNHLPTFLLEHVTHEIVFMEALHDEDDTALFFVVEPAEKGVVVPVVDAAALAFGERLVGFQGIIDGDEIGCDQSEPRLPKSRA